MSVVYHYAKLKKSVLNFWSSVTDKNDEVIQKVSSQIYSQHTLPFFSMSSTIYAQFQYDAFNNSHVML